MPNIGKKIGKMPKGKVTVHDLLGTRNIQRMCDKVISNAYKYESVIIITVNKPDDKDVGGSVDWHGVNTSIERLVYAMEVVKNDILNEDLITEE